MDPRAPEEEPEELHNGWGALFDNDDDDDYTPSECDSDRLSDISDWDPVEAAPEGPILPIYLHNTRVMREHLAFSVSRTRTSILDRVKSILAYMESVDMNLPIFLDALSWGDNACISDPKVQYERSALMGSEELPRILERWYKVPRASTSRHHHVRPQGAREALEEFALGCVEEMVDRELEASSHLFRSPSDCLSEEGLTRFRFSEVAERLQDKVSGAPSVWRLIYGATWCFRRVSQGKSHKDVVSATVTIISQLQYLRSRTLSAWTKPLTVFLKAKGTSAKVLDLLHALGITMSHSWSVRAYSHISTSAMEAVRLVIHRFRWWLAYNNVNFAFKVFSMHLRNQSHFDSGTTGSVFVKPFAPQPPPLSGEALQAQRRIGRTNPITLSDIANLDVAAAPRIHSHIVYTVLRMLLDSPEFDFPTYIPQTDPAIAPPPPVSRLPAGRENITKQFVLGTVHINESTYEGTRDLIAEFLRQLNLFTAKEIEHLAKVAALIWIGDQLTIERLRGLANYRSEDLNGFDRLDWLVFVFGWFHLLMAFANSLHRQYFGSPAGKGLRQAFALLKRPGLQSVQIKGTFYHHLHEGIFHVTEAHIRDCWRKVGGVAELAELRNRSPAELKHLVETLVQHYASNDRVEDLEHVASGREDDFLRQAVMWNRDALRYIVLWHAMRQGDVGLMEDLLPHLFFRFSGGGNHKYAVEILKLLQGLHHEWPEDVKAFVRQNCWVINMKGGEEDWTAIDLAIEPRGQNQSWDLMKQRAPAIPTLRTLNDDISRQFRTIYRGMGHTTPAKEADIRLLDEHYNHARLHIYTPGRHTTNTADKAKEFVSHGFHVANTKIIPKWHTRRAAYERASSQIWPENHRTPDGTRCLRRTCNNHTHVAQLQTSGTSRGARRDATTEWDLPLGVAKDGRPLVWWMLLELRDWAGQAEPHRMRKMAVGDTYRQDKCKGRMCTRHTEGKSTMATADSWREYLG
ncbi:hypothetical protein BD311DRAFT_782804 [Dichomitus squalens]|uniref:DUF6589 domain-containing protein n=1 Tax=Dichomitus squalens TaxID=114155 RepID=A0A4Q9M7N7_9APHY|nr:hypothetical protein BD311DRAFT_782804 [Dichomitus squalens]